MKNTDKENDNDDISYGNVYVMTHSFFNDVIKIGCTPIDPEEYALALSAKTPGNYKVVFSLKCANPCKVKKQIREYLNAKEYVNEFYQVPADVAETLLKRETLRIPIFNAT
ncbi:MAG: GIY-YIG nuclease family protein [Cognaticolwellia sp.]